VPSHAAAGTAAAHNHLLWSQSALSGCNCHPGEAELQNRRGKVAKEADSLVGVSCQQATQGRLRPAQDGLWYSGWQLTCYD
jgi:hypothetical protein